MKFSYKPLIVAVFLVIAGTASRSRISQQANIMEVKGFLGAQSADRYKSYSAAIIGVAEAEDASVSDSAALVQGGGVPADASAGDVAVENSVGNSYAEAAIQDPGQPIGPDMSGLQTVEYTVKKGDTLSTVAAKFNVSADSIVSANPNIRKNSIRIGQTITIPGIASPVSTPTSSLPNFNGNFIMPAQGYDEAALQSDNSVEIENSCGTPVVASADGIVVPDNNIVNAAGGWNDGYGTFILLKHSFGNEIFTRYAHLQQTMVAIGDYVKQGQELGLMGNTGSATACSLDFEVIGAENPFGR